MKIEKQTENYKKYNNFNLIMLEIKNGFLYKFLKC